MNSPGEASGSISMRSTGKAILSGRSTSRVRRKVRIAQRQVRAIANGIEIGPAGVGKESESCSADRSLRAHPEYSRGSIGSASECAMRMATNRCHERRDATARDLKRSKCAGGRCSIICTALGRIYGSNSAVLCDTTGTELDSSASASLSSESTEFQQVFGCHVLRGQHAIQSLRARAVCAMKKVGQVRLAESGLSRKQ